MTENSEPDRAADTATYHVPDVGAPDAADTAPSSTAPTMDEVRTDIAATRAELADTADALANKLNVKKQAQETVAAAKDRISDVATQAKQKAPAPVQQALDRAGPVAQQAAAATAPHRKKIVGAAAAALVLLVILRRRPSRP